MEKGAKIASPAGYDPAPSAKSTNGSYPNVINGIGVAGLWLSGRDTKLRLLDGGSESPRPFWGDRLKFQLRPQVVGVEQTS